ncbi:MAG: hypothetical protein LBJ01_11705 [Tannerella sp.]|jgi:hypothetical protein|nr:hypothetical protein [Tannerella sp.]
MEIFERTGNLLKENPKYFGFFIVWVGIFMLLSSIFNWDWVFKGHTFNRQKIQGTANFWGRGFARIKFGGGGLLCIVLGIIWLIAG